MVKALPQFDSNHTPILLDSSRVVSNPRPFRFELIWLEDKTLAEVVKSSWATIMSHRWLGFVLSSKLKLLKNNLKVWGRDKFTNLVGNIGRLEQEISNLHSLEQLMGGLNTDQLSNRNAKKVELDNYLRLYEIFWFQRSHSKWVKQGDNNTNYFHAIANSRLKSNSLSDLFISEVDMDNPVEVTNSIVDHFEKTFGSDPRLPFDLVEVPFKTLSQDFWEILQFDIMRWLFQLYDDGIACHIINSTFISPIPKKGSISSLKDIRSISLLSGLYSILAKVLANRLRAVINDVIDDLQTAFTKDCYIMDGVMLAFTLRTRRVEELVGLPFFNTFSYFDDTLIVMEGNDVNVHNIWLFLKLYELISRAQASTIVVAKFEALMHNLLWSGSQSKKKIHLVKWDSVCQSKKVGGLGIRHIRSVNDYLLTKWWWRLYANGGQL
ncbi:uncharacterized protein LOC105420937 [Amborella trichopoda]|uniref:uncharacterized protein LOC105420937 n=1 Tax=Amborella trichopoda TaxID=13333 RepID=UPI0005D37721|nr:uncharacterized protein LOC105420937 [Amborella trichopoda]|eukprot:XP_011624794.1 uncharacterized protein LOC105420937 [Amborella trichopoda]